MLRFSVRNPVRHSPESSVSAGWSSAGRRALSSHAEQSPVESNATQVIIVPTNSRFQFMNSVCHVVSVPTDELRNRGFLGVSSNSPFHKVLRTRNTHLLFLYGIPADPSDRRCCFGNRPHGIRNAGFRPSPDIQKSVQICRTPSLTLLSGGNKCCVSATPGC